MKDCLFCKIAAGEIPSSKVYEDENVFAFRDINPQAPVHILVIPKEHMANVLEGVEEHPQAVANVMAAVGKIARQEGIEQFRLISNCGEMAAQSVKHLHFHMLAGAQLSDHMA